MEEATIVNWLKEEGDPVNNGESILEIETDKSTVEIEAPAAGKLGKLLYAVGSVVPIGEVIAYVLDPGEELQLQMASPTTPATNESVAQAGEPELQRKKLETPSGRVGASPVARRLAKELGVDLTSVQGTGPRGRIMEGDVRLVAEQVQTPKPSIQDTPPDSEEVHPIESIRKLTIERMVHSFSSAPHFYLSVEIDASLLIRMRQRLILKIERITNVRPTISDFLIKIAAQALEEHPDVNATWDKVGIRRINDINIGLAVATDRGLIVPVFHNANQKPLHKITTRRKVMVDQAREGKIGLTDLEGGSFTITNLGTYAVDQFNAIINPPQSVIMSVGRIKDRPVVIEDKIIIKPTMIITLSVDHRVLDGAEAARFLDTMVEITEDPYLIRSLW
jgi:pyruvate dehydrogenase E2 component (dihydrolipoamide acetyltransferase)